MKVKPILGAAVGLQAVALTGKMAKLAEQSLKPKQKVSMKKMTKAFTEQIIGTGLLIPSAELASMVEDV